MLGNLLEIKKFSVPSLYDWCFTTKPTFPYALNMLKLCYIFLRKFDFTLMIKAKSRDFESFIAKNGKSTNFQLLVWGFTKGTNNHQSKRRFFKDVSCRRKGKRTFRAWLNCIKNFSINRRRRKWKVIRTKLNSFDGNFYKTQRRRKVCCCCCCCFDYNLGFLTLIFILFMIQKAKTFVSVFPAGWRFFILCSIHFDINFHSFARSCCLVYTITFLRTLHDKRWNCGNFSFHSCATNNHTNTIIWIFFLHFLIYFSFTLVEYTRTVSLNSTSYSFATT